MAAEHDRGRPPEFPEPRRWVVGGGLVVADEGVLLVQNRRRDGRLDWSPPGGVIDTGETLLDGLTREVEEEIGLRGTAPELVGIDPFELRNQILFVYYMHAPRGEIRLGTAELDAYRIVPLNKLVPWNRGTGLALSRWLATRGYYPEAVDFGRHIEEQLR